MSYVGQPERITQQRVITLFREELDYRFLGDWSDRVGNSAIEEGLLTAWLTGRGHTPAQIARVCHRLRTEADNPNRSLYANNQAVFALLRYGVQVKTEAGKAHETIPVIDWHSPEANDFVIVEEVTLKGGHERRPDLVLYLNGLAIAVLELKNSRVSIGEGIRQLRSNQKPEFNAGFFTTAQILLAGNDSEGLRYGAIGTPEKYYLAWKEDEADNSRFKLDKYLLKLCTKDRLIELLRDFVLFDGGVKKLPRVHQYFGIKAAQDYLRRGEGGIIWHTQGSGKSLVMVLLARWILANNPNARVVIITDRDDLDAQIERVFCDAGESIYRTRSGRDLMRQLGQARPRLLCSLVHKFGSHSRGKDGGDFEAFIKDLEGQPSQTVGEVFVFVDECHRTQSGKLHRVMKAMMPEAVFLGFTGTPLLARDRATSLEVFGDYIHTYKFSEAVADAVVLDLIYEARDIDQHLGSRDKIDAWFEAKTQGLNDWRKEELKRQWGTLQSVLSSRSRMERVVSDILFDFSVKRRLSSGRGNAMLVASSIFEACKYFALLQKTPFKGKCAVVTSYNPQAGDVSKEEVGANTETDKQFIYNTYTELLQGVVAHPGMTRTETYEMEVKARFIKEPANMKLLVVVDKLLTGYDAPPCTYIYLDKSMQDHALFQAICRTIRLDDALEALAVLCEPVEPPKGELEHIHYFCGNTEIPTDLQEREPLRAALYKATVALIRAYANIADDLEAAGYGAAGIAGIKNQLDHYLKLREIIRGASGETLDLKPYEADMRHLIDTYIQADEARTISPFENLSLIDLIVKTGIADAIASRLGAIKENRDAVAETIENNVRSKIIKEQLSDPAFFAALSAQLQEIIELRKSKAIEYEEYLQRIAELARQAEAGQPDDTPAELDTPGKRALWNNLKAGQGQSEAVGEDPKGYGDPLDRSLELALKIDAVVKQVRPDGWRGMKAKEQVIKAALFGVLQNMAEVERLFLVIQAQPEY